MLRTTLELAALGLIYFAISSWRTRDLLPADESGPAPAFTLQTLDGATVTAESLRGKTVLLHFWATWCTVCKQEFAALNAAFDRLGKDEALLTIVADADDAERLRRFAQERQLRYPIALADKRILRQFKINSFPTNYYLNKQGAVESRDIGMTTRWGFRTRMGCAR